MATRVLILDDDQSLTRTIALVMSILGYDSVQCHCPQEAMARLLEEPFQLLLTDYEMPLMNGLSLVQKLRDEGCMSRVILMSGNVAAIDIFLSQQLDISAILTKPFGLTELKEMLHAVLFSTSTPAAVDLTPVLVESTSL